MPRGKFTKMGTVHFYEYADGGLRIGIKRGGLWHGNAVRYMALNKGQRRALRDYLNGMVPGECPR